MTNSLFWLACLSWLAIRPGVGGVAGDQAGPELLDFQELVTLSETARPEAPLQAKLETLLRTPVISNAAAQGGIGPHRPTVDGLGPVVRVAQWNIERGLNFDLVRLALSDPDGFVEAARQRGGLEASKQAQIERQLHTLKEADIVVLNEVDLGMTRTGYREVARDLAQALGMNYAFGVEFVEVDRLNDLGLEKVRLEDPALEQRMRQDLAPDPARYKGLEGNAILSRYPIEKARIFRLPVCHDWYHAEKAAISRLEKGKRGAAHKIFLERIEREVRQGGRMALIADVRIPELPEGAVTVVGVHLENKCKPGCRAKQMDALLARIQETDNPVIVAGDFNTSGGDAAPTSIRRELMTRVTDYEFWVTQALKWGTPVGLPLTALTPVKYLKNYHDPTSAHVPVLAGNKEAVLFRHVEKFRFADGTRFDFRGDTQRNSHDKAGTLANSNQRGSKGFVPTFALKRDFGGLIGRYKLDWILVKPYIREPRGDGMSYRFAPHLPFTMRAVNGAVPEGVSDHAPITVDLPLTDPGK
jgi:endonuclease/exonuclease/phosphatase family metal-dependent hydrolase